MVLFSEVSPFSSSKGSCGRMTFFTRDGRPMLAKPLDKRKYLDIYIEVFLWNWVLLNFWGIKTFLIGYL